MKFETMNTQAKTGCLTEDFRRYSLSHKTYEKKAVYLEFRSWIQQGLSDVVSQLRRTCLSNEVYLLSVGGGAGKCLHILRHYIAACFRYGSDNCVQSLSFNDLTFAL